MVTNNIIYLAPLINNPSCLYFKTVRVEWWFYGSRDNVPLNGSIKCLQTYKACLQNKVGDRETKKNFRDG